MGKKEGRETLMIRQQKSLKDFKEGILFTRDRVGIRSMPFTGLVETLQSLTRLGYKLSARVWVTKYRILRVLICKRDGTVLAKIRESEILGMKKKGFLSNYQ